MNAADLITRMIKCLWEFEGIIFHFMCNYRALAMDVPVLEYLKSAKSHGVQRAGLRRGGFAPAAKTCYTTLKEHVKSVDML